MFSSWHSLAHVSYKSLSSKRFDISLKITRFLKICFGFGLFGFKREKVNERLLAFALGADKSAHCNCIAHIIPEW